MTALKKDEMSLEEKARLVVELVKKGDNKEAVKVLDEVVIGRRVGETASDKFTPQEINMLMEMPELYDREMMTNTHPPCPVLIVGLFYNDISGHPPVIDFESFYQVRDEIRTDANAERLENIEKHINDDFLKYQKSREENGWKSS